MNSESFAFARLSAHYLDALDFQKISQRFPDVSKKISRLESIQGHIYQNKNIALCALFHRSSLVFWSADKKGLKSNEELEFLGDAFIGYFVAAEAMVSLGQFNEAHLSRLRSVVAGTKNLAACAVKLGLHETLLTGQVDLFKANGEPNALLADMLEATTAAILIDAGTTAANSWLRRVLLNDIMEFGAGAGEKDDKSLFQEWVQSGINTQPEYRVLSVIESATQPRIEVAVYVFDKRLEVATAENKKTASQIVATKLMDKVRSHELTIEKLRQLISV